MSRSSPSRCTTTFSTATRRLVTRRRTGSPRCATASPAVAALHDRVQMWRLHYFVDLWRLRQFSAVLLLRCGSRMTAAKRRTLERFLDGDRSLTEWLTLGARGAREFVGTPETLGAEWVLFNALAWRRLLALSARLASAAPPAAGRAAAALAVPGARPQRAGGRAPARSSARSRRCAGGCPTTPRARINLLIPTIDLDHFFGGYIAKFNLARRLAQRGHAGPDRDRRSRRPAAPDWTAQGPVLRRARRAAGHGRDRVRARVGRRSSAVATTASSRRPGGPPTSPPRRSRSLDGDRFVYLIQEYEPFTFPMGTYAALASESYRLPALRGVLVRAAARLLPRALDRRLRRGPLARRRATRSRFRTRSPGSGRSPLRELAARTSRRLLFYARPEPHAARNMFELGVLGLARAAREGVFAGGWELNGVGSVGRRWSNLARRPGRP